MARYRGPRVKIVRRLGELPGLTTKVPNRNYGPGQHGQTAATKKLHNSVYVYKKNKNYVIITG